VIDSYFRSILTVLNSSLIVASHNVNFDKLSTQFGVRRFTYAYHYQRAEGSFVFRYDNTGHFPGLLLFPHHKHVGDESNVIPHRPSHPRRGDR
jgi:hypothetical protein